MKTDALIDAFRRGTLDLDCKKMVLRLHKEGGPTFHGQGYIRQDESGALIFKIYVSKYENVDPLNHFHAQLHVQVGKLHADDMFYDLAVTAHDGRCWSADRILPAIDWDMGDGTALIRGPLQSITSEEDIPEGRDRLRLHFFEEYALPLHLMTHTTEHGSDQMVLDRAEFDAQNAEFEVRVRSGSGDTVFDVSSEGPFPPAYHLRIQEALQYITGKAAIWRARQGAHGGKLIFELASPTRKSLRTQFNPPISPGSVAFRSDGWHLFKRYLDYVVESTEDTHWNPVAFHLYNACESTANSVDAWAVGIAVAAEAIASLIPIPKNKATGYRIKLLQRRMREYLRTQPDLIDVAPRMDGLINAMGTPRAQDVMYALAATGHAEHDYVDAWTYLRNRHVHPTLKDLRKPDQTAYQDLFDKIKCVEVLLRQLTFNLIGYEGSFTDYGAENFPARRFPLPKSATFKPTYRDRRL
jgi:hypothetical protein